MPRGNKILIRTGSAAPSAGDFAVSEPAWDSSSGKLYVKNAAGSMVEVGGGSSSLATYATTANFPATGSATVLYLAEDTSRLFQWESPVYVEIGTAGGGFSHAASHAADGNDSLTLSAAQIGSGTLDAARLPASAVLTSDARLSDSRSPTGAAGGDLAGIYPNPTIAPGAVVTADIADAAVTDAKIAAMAASKLTGTLDDARLSASVVTTSALHSRLSMPTTAVETFPRMAISFLAMTSGNVLYSFFTPLTTLTVSQVTMLSGGTAAAGLTLARIGLVAYDEATGTATLVAQTASDTSLFTSTRTAFTRSFSTAGGGGFPASYTLQAGTRYGVALLCIGTTMPTVQGNAGLAEMSALTPRLSAIRTSQSDLSTVTATGAQSQVLYARFS